MRRLSLTAPACRDYGCAVPSNREAILALVRSEPGLSDRELVARSGIEPHQQVNRICRILAGRGLIERVRGPRGVIVNNPLPALEGYEAETAQNRVDVRVTLEFSTVGEATVENDDVRLPEMPHEPGLYRFTVSTPQAGDTVCFGETTDLARRMYGYRNPGSSQRGGCRDGGDVRRRAAADGHARERVRAASARERERSSGTACGLSDTERRRTGVGSCATSSGAARQLARTGWPLLNAALRQPITCRQWPTSTTNPI